MKQPFVFLARILTILLAGWLLACARQSAPTGGPKDTTPPKVDTLASTPNFSTRFNQKRIEIQFDEWVTLSDVGTQVVVSPPLVTKRLPDVKLRGKTVIVDFPAAETLRPNTTYTINFGSSVKDLHEGNAAEDLRFVFSTGDFIDSLSVKGTVVDAFTGEPVENVSVMLYDNLSDSVPRLEKPYYFSRTDKNGQYTLENVRAGTFRLVAVEDEDQNLKWSGDNERVAFPDTFVQVNDTLRNVLVLRLFKDRAGLRLIEKATNRYGFLRLTYNAPPDSVVLKTETPGLRLITERDLDTLLVWYDLPAPTAWSLAAGKDTVSVRSLSRDDFLKTHRLGFPGEVVPAAGQKGKKGAAPAPAPLPAGAKPAIPTINQNASKAAVLTFNFPVTGIDTSKWRLVVDSSRFQAFTVVPDSMKPRNVRLRLAWRPGKTYNLTLLPGAITDFYGVSNVDTLQRNFNVFPEKQLGGLNLTLQSLTPGAPYILQLLVNDKVVEEERMFEAVTGEKRFVFTNLPATTYTARLIEDRNRNGRWDAGSYFARRQPEAVFNKKLEPLRGNWEIEATMEASAQFKRKK